MFGDLFELFDDDEMAFLPPELREFVAGGKSPRNDRERRARDWAQVSVRCQQWRRRYAGAA